MSTEQPIQEICKDGNVTFYFIGRPESTISPLAAFAANIPNVSCVISSHLYKAYDDNNFAICLVDFNKIRVACDTQNRIIFITTAFLEFFWLLIFCNMSRENRRRNHEKGSDETPSMEALEMAKAEMAAYQRCKELSMGIMRPWPSIIPYPDNNSNVNDHTPASYATELVQYALGFIILHEFAHWKQYDEATESDNLMVNEIQADTFAIQAYLDRVWFNNEITGKRANAWGKKMLALIECGGMLTFLDQLRKGKDNSHPSGISRLWSMFREENTGEINIFDFDDDENYAPKDKDFDMRPSVGYAADMLYFFLQVIVQPPTEELELKKERLLRQQYDSPAHLLKVLRDFYQELERHKKPATE